MAAELELPTMANSGLVLCMVIPPTWPHSAAGLYVTFVVSRVISRSFVNGDYTMLVSSQQNLLHIHLNIHQSLCLLTLTLPMNRTWRSRSRI